MKIEQTKKLILTWDEILELVKDKYKYIHNNPINDNKLKINRCFIINYPGNINYNDKFVIVFIDNLTEDSEETTNEEDIPNLADDPDTDDPI
jgi:hypothetical protein